MGVKYIDVTNETLSAYLFNDEKLYLSVSNVGLYNGLVVIVIF